MNEVKGKVAFITGGASGIGLSMAKAFIKSGIKVAIADIEKTALDQAEKELKALSGEVLALQVDVTDRDAMENAARQTEKKFGKVHILCNNAGVGISKPGEETTYDDWDWVLGVNLFGVVNGIRTFSQRILSHGEGGHIVNTASIAGIFPEPGLCAYNTSKFAVVGMSESLQQSLEPKGVGVSVLCPGFVITNIFRSERNRPQGLTIEEAPVQISMEKINERFKELKFNLIDADIVGEAVLEAILNNEFYIFTHPEFKMPLVEKMQRQLKAFDDAKARDKRRQDKIRPLS